MTSVTNFDNAPNACYWASNLSQYLARGIMVHPRAVRMLVLFIGYREGMFVSKEWYCICANDVKRLLEHDDAKHHVISVLMTLMKVWSRNEELLHILRHRGEPQLINHRSDNETFHTILFKANAMMQMDRFAHSFSEEFIRKIIHTYIISFHVDNGVSGLLDNSFYYEDEESQPTIWFKRLMGKLDIVSIRKQDWPQCFFSKECIGAFRECHGSNIECVGQVMVAMGQLYPELRSIALCGIPETEDYDHNWENPNNLVQYIFTLGATCPNISYIDMGNTPINDSVVNAVSSSFGNLTSFCAKTGVFGYTISSYALEALRTVHPDIAVTIWTSTHPDQT